jgi:DnaK suppressor protein
MNATAKKSAKKTVAAKTKTAKSASKPASKAVKKPVAPAKKAAAKTAVKAAGKKTASPAVKKPAPKPAISTAKKASAPAAKKAAPVKPAVKKTVAEAPKKAAPEPVKPAVEKTRPAVQPVSDMTPSNSGKVFVDTIQKSEVSKVSEVATKTAKAAPFKAPVGRLLTEEEILAMDEQYYMNEAQLAFFKARLQALEKELLKNADETTEHLRETVLVPDPADRATIEEEHALELRTRDRERKLLKKVQQSLASIDAGDYGWCEETGEPIGIPRLLARPTATLSLEAQQRRELKQKLYGD